MMAITQRSKAPLTADERKQLRDDLQDLMATAKRKGNTLDKWEMARELRIGQAHFELGCWLKYYSRKVGLDGKEGLEARIDCLRRLFLEGIVSPGYDFFTAFDFSERDFDTIFEMGDGDEVVRKLREFIACDKTGRIKEGFKYMAWSLYPQEQMALI